MSSTRRKATPATESPPLAGLRFAIYARKSTEDARHEDHKSTARQIEQATRFVEARGGEILPDHIYADEATSGAEFQDRPGLFRFLNVLENGRPFNALVMMDDDRLGRDQYRTNYVLQQIVDSGCRVFTYLDGGREIRLDNETEKFMQSVRAFGAALEREKARQRARDAAERKARQGHVTGGEPFGYVNIHYQGGREVPRGQPHDYVKRRIKEDEAEAVRGMFRMHAAGWGLTKIAKAMNGVPTYAEQNREFFGGRNVAPPRHGTGSWSPTAVREILYRRLYHGEIVWGRTTNTDRNGRAGISVRREERDWLVVPAPGLKIVPDALWEAVQQRLKMVNENYLRDSRGKLWGKPDLRREGGYLLSGLAMCGECGWNLAVIGGSRRVYGCVQRHRRGTCGNNLTQLVPIVDAAFLGALEREALTPERFRYAVACGVARVREQLATEPDRGPALEREKVALARKIERMVAAIGDGRGPAALVQEIAKAEARIKEIDAELARLAAAPALGDLDLMRIERDVAAQLERFADVLKGNVPRARQALKKLLVDRVRFNPIELGNGKRTYAFEGELAYGAVVREAVYMGSAPLGPPPRGIAGVTRIPLRDPLRELFRPARRHIAVRHQPSTRELAHLGASAGFHRESGDTEVTRGGAEG
jgi:DNA invertase Pin-like site-specific DNA recombinase